MSLISEKFVKAVRAAAVCNPDEQAVPACILWPDGDRQWEPAAARMLIELPEMFILGDYDPANRTGPAIWLRCVIAGKATNMEVPAGSFPILYLPGVSRQDLRAVDSCPDHLKPLAELQYSGVIWSQVSSKDWTILAFLKSNQGGLGLDVSQDNGTRNAMQLALNRILDEDVESLQGKRLDKDYFNTLLTGGDPVRDMLLWLDQGDVFRAGRDENAWIGFVEVCKSQLAFDPENDGNLKGAGLLAGRKGPWLPVWERYCEAPKRYPNIPSLIRQCTPFQEDLFSNAETHGCWPQWNDEQEKELKRDLLALEKLAPHVARKKLLEYEKQHGARRSLVWAELGEATLACAMGSLAVLGDITGQPLTAGTAEELAVVYAASGWQADDSVVQALACLSKQDDFEAVKAAIRTVYMPWLEDGARYLQKIAASEGYPGNRDPKACPASKQAGEAYFFIDGLRFDVARRVSDRLSLKKLRVEETPVWAAVPTVTATAKPAVTPVAHLIVGQEANADFEPCVASTGKSLKGGYHFQKLLADEGWQPPGKLINEDPAAPLWYEGGNIDKEGHDRGWKLARNLDSLLEEISEQVERLLSMGFRTIRIVTDHGWLLMPGGLPKTKLPSCLTETTWGRCAALKPGAVTDERLFPWFWNQHQEFALADGISCYRAGMDYAHGGVSLQECLTLQLTVSADHKPGAGSNVHITDIVWRGLRCKVAIEGEPGGLSLDLRLQAGNLSSTIVMGVKPFKENGTGSVVVEDGDMEGREATVVVLDEEGNLVAQCPTVVSEENK